MKLVLPKSFFLILLPSLLVTRFYMLGHDIVNRDSFHSKNWSYVFMKEFESGSWDKLFVSIWPGVLTIYSNIIGFKFLYLLKDRFGIISATGKDFELLLHIYQKTPQSILIVVLSLIAFWLIKNLFSYKTAFFFLLVYTFEPFFIIMSRFIQTDALQAILIFVSLLFLLNWDKEKKRIYLISSGVIAGLAFIEKSSSIALLPFVGLIAIFLNLDKWPLKRKNTISVIKRATTTLLVFTVLFFISAFLFFPAYWFHPIDTFLRMTLDAYIHGVGGVNLDSYEYVRPDNIGLGARIKTDATLLKYILYNHSSINIIGMLGGLYLLVKRKTLNAKTNKYLLILVGFPVYYFLIVQVSSLQFYRYLIVSTIPLTILSGVFYSYLSEKWKHAFSALVLIIVVLGTYTFVRLAPDWGAYSNIFARFTNNERGLTGGTGGYKLGKYLEEQYGPNKSVMIGDHTALYLFYPGKVIDYEKELIGTTDIIITSDSAAEFPEYENKDVYNLYPPKLVFYIHQK